MSSVALKSVGFWLAVNVFIVKIVLKVIPLILCSLSVWLSLKLWCGLPYDLRIKIRMIIKTFIVTVIFLDVNRLYTTCLNYIYMLPSHDQFGALKAPAL